MIQKLKKILSSLTLLTVALVFTVGLIFSAELVWRAVGAAATEGVMIDVAMFPYKHYLVTTHPANLELGKSKHVLEKFFAKGDCAGPDGITARFNSDGFRTHDLNSVPAKEPGEIRIILTGASAAMGWNIGEACTLDSHLYRLFETHYPNQKVRIFNLGNGAWKSFQELLAIEMYGLKLKPDLIIAFDGYNDIQHAFTMPIQQPYHNNAEIAFNRYQNWVEGRVLELFKSLKIVEALKQFYLDVHVASDPQNSLKDGDPKLAEAPKPGQLATKMQHPISLSDIANRTDFDPYNKEAVDFYLRNERLMAKAASLSNGKVIYALAPNLYLKTPLSDAERETLDKYAGSVNFVVQGYVRMRQGLKRIAAEEENAIFYDMSTVFNNNENTIFSDSEHFSKNGYEIVARNLFQKIEEALSLKKPIS